MRDKDSVGELIELSEDYEWDGVSNRIKWIRVWFKNIFIFVWMSNDAFLNNIKFVRESIGNFQAGTVE